MMRTTHECLRNCVIKRRLDRAAIRGKMLDPEMGLDPEKVDAALDRFLSGGPACMAIAIAITSLIADGMQTRH